MKAIIKLVLTTLAVLLYILIAITIANTCCSNQSTAMTIVSIFILILFIFLILKHDKSIEARTFNNFKKQISLSDFDSYEYINPEALEIAKTIRTNVASNFKIPIENINPNDNLITMLLIEERGMKDNTFPLVILGIYTKKIQREKVMQLKTILNISNYIANQ